MATPGQEFFQTQPFSQQQYLQRNQERGNEAINEIASLLQAYKAGTITFDQYTQEYNRIVSNPTFDANQLIMMAPFEPSQVRSQEQAAQRGRLQNQYNVQTGLADLARQLGVTGIALNQINTSNRGLAQAPPELPTPPPADPMLSQELFEAQRRAKDVSYATNPALQEIQNAYLQGTQQAQNLGGGQAANVMGMANLLNQQRMQAALGLAPIAQQARLQNQEVVNNLLGQRLQQNQQQFANQMATNQILQDRYNMQQQAFGQAGAAGRYNLANILQNFRLPEYFNWIPVDDETRSMMEDTEKRFRFGDLFRRRNRTGFGTSPDDTASIESPY